MELIAALAILSIATYIGISLFNASRNLARDSRSVKVAASLAQERLVDIQLNPRGYVWPALAGGRLAELVPRETTESPQRVEAPSFFPTDTAASGREQVFYDRYRWRAYVKGPQADPNHIEVTVMVYWQAEGRERHFALTSCLPRSVAEAGP